MTFLHVARFQKSGGISRESCVLDRFGICVLSLERFLRQNALSGLPHVNLEAQISCEPQSADFVAGATLCEPLEVQISCLSSWQAQQSVLSEACCQMLTLTLSLSLSPSLTHSHSHSHSHSQVQCSGFPLERTQSRERCNGHIKCNVEREASGFPVLSHEMCQSCTYI